MQEPKGPSGPVPHGPGLGSARLVQLAEAMATLSQGADGLGTDTLSALVDAAVDQVPGVRWASVTTLRSGTFRTEAASDSVADRADAIQYDVGSGPCVDAVLDDTVYVTGDVSQDPRWGDFGPRAKGETGIVSVLSHRLNLLGGSNAVACLNMYSDAEDAFGEESLAIGLVLATHAAVLVTSVVERDRAHHLQRALESNRDIGVAVGILMRDHALTRAQAFDVLRVASQDSNRKLVDVAAEVAETGTISLRSRHP